MNRSALVDEIRRLERTLRDGADVGVTSVGDRLGAQITRLEAAAIKLERRMLELDQDPGAETGADEREELAGRLERLRTKIARLEASRPLDEEMAGFARPAGVAAQLRRMLHELVTRLHRDPSVAPPDVRPFQQRLSELVRERRARLEAVAARLKDARDYLASAAGSTRALAATAEELPPDGAPGLPFHEERAAIVTRLEMAQVAARDAHREFVALAHDWPELSELAKRPDWTKLPFAALQRSLMPPDEPGEGASPEPATRLRSALAEAYQAIRATALWLQELRTHVQQVPRPD